MYKFKDTQFGAIFQNTDMLKSNISLLEPEYDFLQICCTSDETRVEYLQLNLISSFSCWQTTAYILHANALGSFIGISMMKRDCQAWRNNRNIRNGTKCTYNIWQICAQGTWQKKLFYLWENLVMIRTVQVWIEHVHCTSGYNNTCDNMMWCMHIHVYAPQSKTLVLLVILHSITKVSSPSSRFSILKELAYSLQSSVHSW